MFVLQQQNAESRSNLVILLHNDGTIEKVTPSNASVG